ncbi:FecR domain-containing protein [Chitinophaga horti]|uniref:FecR domain-containing protein n=1 Tax=Chitinophaga horti TaxID=2920382 RepID=A0ABY6IUB5_9BACT|nr:FecR family protein [Chitinophaga horti]UYQ90966.1 FecR domain-containing protein [Chitinophaga horti]
MPNLADIQAIFDRCMQGTATQAERDLLHDWMEEPQNEAAAIKLWEDAFAASDGSLQMDAQSREQMVTTILRSQPARVKRLNPWLKYAAAIVVLIAAAGYLWLSRQQPATQVAKQLSLEDITPGRTGAILTLADGSTISLDSSANGIIARQNGTNVSLQNGQLSYNAGEATTQTVAYNTMTTPKGMQYSLVLPDGSKVWLNAASSLTYPTLFNGKERRVEIKGEAYFEIAPNATQPFFVNIKNKAEIQVLGTSFNVNAYDDEPAINTTLVTGKVRIHAGAQATLAPGQEARITAGASSIAVKPGADIDKALAWKNGVFDFNGAKLEEVMKQLSRWYDIDVVYEQGIPDKEFFGKMSRDVTLAGLLRGLEDAEVHFRLEAGRRLVVLR